MEITEEDFARLQRARAAFIELERVGVLARREQPNGSALIIQLRPADNAIEQFDLDLLSLEGRPINYQQFKEG